MGHFRSDGYPKRGAGMGWVSKEVGAGVNLEEGRGAIMVWYRRGVAEIKGFHPFGTILV